jgi:hypothetical protein
MEKEFRKRKNETDNKKTGGAIFRFMLSLEGEEKLVWKPINLYNMNTFI